MITGYHYSTSIIATGEKIRSNQHTQTSFNLVWGLYKQVADELGIALPREYGYAYPAIRDNFKPFGPDAFWKMFVVSAPQSSIITCNLNYSVYKTMAELGGFVDRSIKALADRLAKRDVAVRKNAHAYFTNLADPKEIELISDQWIVT
jgi:hypothetical protein